MTALGFYYYLVLALCLTASQGEQVDPSLDIAKLAASMTVPNDTRPNLYRPYQALLDVSKYPVAPSGLKLEQVHVYVRHGERTPVRVRLADPPGNIPQHWIMCKSARMFEAFAGGTKPDDWQQPFSRLVERADGTAVAGECLLGELTDLGRKSTLNYGKALRELYVEKLQFLPDTLSNSKTTYFRTTNIPRTIESLQQVIHGLYPLHKCESPAVPAIVMRNGLDDNLLGNTYACKRLEILQVGFAQAAAAAYNHTFEPFDKKLSKYFGGNPLRLDGKPRASGVLDTVRASIAHGIKVPPEFEDKTMMDVIERGVVTEWFAGYKTEEVRRLGMGRLLDDLARKMQNKVKLGDKDPLKILVHSTHDTGLAGLLSTLDVYDDKWPAFTASITFELFKKEQEPVAQPLLQSILSRRKNTSEYYVRMRYQNKNMYLPICSDDGKHLPGSPEFCTLAAFKERVEALTPTDFEAECSPSGRTTTTYN